MIQVAGEGGVQRSTLRAILGEGVLRYVTLNRSRRIVGLAPSRHPGASFWRSSCDPKGGA